MEEIKDNKEPNKQFIKRINKIKKEFSASVNNDLNTPLALSKLHMIITETNKVYKKGIGKGDAGKVIEILLEFDKVLGLSFADQAKKNKIPSEVESLILEREKLRKEKKFFDADKIRATLKESYNVIIEDTEHGTSWHKSHPKPN
jgi:cysteinyl-tRNA synthetase